eukprot:2325346-Rhodomonas_salina.2
MLDSIARLQTRELQHQFIILHLAARCLSNILEILYRHAHRERVGRATSPAPVSGFGKGGTELSEAVNPPKQILPNRPNPRNL